MEVYLGFRSVTGLDQAVQAYKRNTVGIKDPSGKFHLIIK